MKTPVRIKKLEGDMQLVYGEVYSPVLLPDTDGDIMTPDEIRKIAHKFISSGSIDKIDLMHDGVPTGSKVVESFLARDGDPDFLPGSWVLGVKIEDEALWEDVREGNLNGFSMEIEAKAVEVEVEIELPEYVEGTTTLKEDHIHRYKVRFDDQGRFLGGETDVVELGGVKHKHQIKRGTVTEKAAGHNHRFAMVDVLAALNPVLVGEE